MPHASQLCSQAELAWGKHPGPCRPGENKLARGRGAGRKVCALCLCPSASVLCLTFVLFLVAAWLHFLPLLFPSKTLLLLLL